MISNYLSTENDFNSIIDPIKENWGPYWYLNKTRYENYCWNTSVFSEEEIERIKIFGIRLGIDRATTNGLDKDCLEHRRSFTSWIHPNSHTEWIYKRITDLATTNNQSFFNFDLTMIETLQFTYYSSNEKGCYKGHTDPLCWNNPHNRKLSLIIQLSDPNEYEGGELKLYTSHDPITIKKEKGLVVTFPSYTLHEVTPVTKGERYSLVAWIHGPAFR